MPLIGSNTNIASSNVTTEMAETPDSAISSSPWIKEEMTSKGIKPTDTARSSNNTTHSKWGAEPEPLTFRDKVAIVMEGGPITTALTLTIIVAISAFIVESMPDLNGDENPEYATFWWCLELVANVIFTLEFVVKWYIERFSCQFFHPTKRFLNLIDFAAIVPFYFEVLANMWGGSAPNLQFLRAVRLFRVIRAVKLGKSSAGVKVFIEAIVTSAPHLCAMVFFMIVAGVCLASITFVLERGTAEPGPTPAGTNCEPGQWEDDPDCEGTGWGTFFYKGIPDTFYWNIVTQTTVGYGDMYPVTLLGRLVAFVSLISGSLVFGLPITVIGVNYENAFHTEVQSRMMGEVKALVLATLTPSDTVTLAAALEFCESPAIGAINKVDHFEVRGRFSDTWTTFRTQGDGGPISFNKFMTMIEGLELQIAQGEIPEPQDDDDPEGTQVSSSPRNAPSQEDLTLATVMRIESTLKDRRKVLEGILTKLNTTTGRKSGIFRM